ncbi:unnamed protein product [Dibothriocephalus latus]|uniref:Uncharacterized protein n=1 Tax=Dibothriocephalus latus TaxID=60516 RepID=A0A3P7NW37_DIBLA|nr:unnamed protein product [Dibothriocephalus latus]
MSTEMSLLGCCWSSSCVWFFAIQPFSFGGITRVPSRVSSLSLSASWPTALQVQSPPVAILICSGKSPLFGPSSYSLFLLFTPSLNFH